MKCTKLIILCLFTLSMLCYRARGGNFTFDFNQGIPTGSQLAYSAQWAATGGVNNSGVVKLTTAAPGQGGEIALAELEPGKLIAAFTLQLKVYIGGGSNPPADGFYISLSQSPTGQWIDGLALVFDSYRNPGEVSPAISLTWNQTLIGRIQTGVSQGPGGNAFLDVNMRLDPDGTVDVSYNGNAIFTNIATGYQPQAGAKFRFAAQTGGLFDNHWIDDVHIITTPVYQAPVFTDPPHDTNVKQGQGVTLTAAVEATGTLTWQWRKDGLNIPGATASSYSIPNAQPWHTGNYSVVVSNGTDTASSAAVAVGVSPFAFNAWQGLMAYYPLNAALPGHDFGILGLHTTDQGTGASLDSWGRSDGARRFVSTESDGMATASSTFFHSPVEFTWTAWVKTSGSFIETSTRIISTEGPDGSGQPGFALYANSNGKFGAGLNWWAGGQGFESSAVYPANVWRHVAATYDGSRLRLFVDGVQVGSRLYTGVTLTSDSPLYFGKYRTNIAGNTGGFFDGWLDEVRFYNRVLSTADLVQLRASDDGMDIDGDGLGDAWEARYGFSAAANEAAGDADGDGMTNREEYVAGSNPVNAASNYNAPQLNEIPVLNVLNLTWHGSPARNYAVQFSADLINWQTLAMLPGLTGPTSLVVEPPVRPVRHYYKVVVVP